MSLIQNIREFPSKQQESKPALLMCGFGGNIWQVKRLINTLNRAGYDHITAANLALHPTY